MKKSLVLKDWSGCALVMREDYASKRGYRMSILESHIKMSRPWLMYINFLENQLSGPSFALLRFNSNVSFQNGRTDIVEAHETQPVSKQILNVTRVNCVETMNCLFEYFSYLPRRQKENINWWAQVFRASQIFLKNFLRSLNDGASLTSDPSTLILEISTLNDLTCLTRRLSKLTFCLKLAIMRQKDGQKWTPPLPLPL